MAVAAQRAYAILGHGCDNADHDILIPPGSSYVTLEMCGNASYELPKIIYAFNDPDVNADIRDPTPEAIQNLNRYFSIGEYGNSNILNRHYPHTQVPNPQNSLLAQLDLNELGGVIFKSGIYEISVPPPFINNEWGRTFMHFPQGTPITVDNLMEIYRGSVYQPDYAIIFQNGPIANVRILADILGGGGMFNVYNYMLNNPGVYYNFACRTECTGNVLAARRARNRSLRRIQMDPGNIIEKPPLPNAAALFDYLNYWVSKKVADLQEQPEPPVPDWHAVAVEAGRLRMAQRLIGPRPMNEDGGGRKIKKKNKSQRKRKTRRKR